MEAEIFSSAKVVLIRTLFPITQNHVNIESCSRDLTQLLSLLFNIKNLKRKKKRERDGESERCDYAPSCRTPAIGFFEDVILKCVCMNCLFTFL